MQRDPTIFPRPDEFLPQRWIDAQGTAEENAMRELMIVWGKGQRACLGKTVAILEMKIGIAALVKRYFVELGSRTTDDDMEMTDHNVLIPKGGKCMLLLSKVGG